MAKHLTNRDIKLIVELIRAHKKEKLTWKGICEASESIIGKKPTRQSLAAHKQIKSAYNAKKELLKLNSPSTPKPSSLSAASYRIARLQSENYTLKMQNAALLEQFVVWQYNAFKLGITEGQLSMPLPRIDRETTEE